MKRLLLLFLTALTALAAPLERDLGQGLTYYRAHRLPSDLPAEANKKPSAIVLDLRFTEGDSDAAIALDAWLKFRARSTTPVLLLINASTSSTLSRALAQRASASGLVSIGIASADFTPNIIVTIAPETERRAYDALEHGTDATALINDSPAKPRHDEAELARLRQTHAPDTSAEDEALAATTPPPSPAPPPPLIDRALQRAVQLHRALLALRKIPAA